MRFLLSAFCFLVCLAVFAVNPIYDGKLQSPLNGSGFPGTNFANPTAAQDLATKAYVDANGGAGVLNLTNEVEITVASRGILNGLSAVTNNGANFGPDTPGTTSCGLQEALNSIPRGTNFGPWANGAALRLDAGYFFYTNALFFSNVFTSGIKITGAGRLNTKLVYAGSATGTNCFTLKGGGNTNADAAGPGGKTIDLPLHVILRDLGFSAINETTNVLCCITNDSYIEVSRCLFTSWNIMTNQVWGSAVSITGTGYTNAQGLVGLVVGSLLDFHVSVDDCFFIGLADGVAGYADHFYTRGIVTAMIGSGGDSIVRNLWPTNHPYALGAAIIIGRTSFNVYCELADLYAAHVGVALLETTPDIEVFIDNSEWEGIDVPLAMSATNTATFFLKGHVGDFQSGTHKIAAGDYTTLTPCPAKLRTVIYDNPATLTGNVTVNNGGITATQFSGGPFTGSFTGSAATSINARTNPLPLGTLGGSNYFFARAVAPAPGGGGYNPAGAATGEGIVVETSENGQDWNSIQQDGRFQYTNTVGARDPCMKYDATSGKWFCVFTRQGPNLADYATNFGVISSTNLIDWVDVCTNRPNTMTATSIIWHPQLFLDGSTWYVVYAHHGYTGGNSYEARIEVVAAANGNLTSFGSATIIATNTVDASQGLIYPTLVKQNGIYWLFAKNEGLDPGYAYAFTNASFPGTLGGFRYSHTATTFEIGGAGGMLQLGSNFVFYGGYFGGNNSGESFRSFTPSWPPTWTIQQRNYETPRFLFGHGTVESLDGDARRLAFANSGRTNINAAQLTSGTIPAARMPAITLGSVLTADNTYNAAGGIGISISLSDGGAGLIIQGPNTSNLIVGKNGAGTQVFGVDNLGAVTATSFSGDGSGLTLASVGTAGTYRSVTTDAKGRVTAGSNPTTFSGYGMVDTVANLGTTLSDETSFGLAALQSPSTLVSNNFTPVMTFSNRVYVTNGATGNWGFNEGDSHFESNRVTGATFYSTNGVHYWTNGSDFTITRAGFITNSSDAIFGRWRFSGSALYNHGSFANAVARTFTTANMALDENLSGLYFRNDYGVAWSANTDLHSFDRDTGIYRDSAAVVQVTSGVRNALNATLKTGSGIFTNNVIATNGFIQQVVTKTADYTATVADDTILVNATTKTITLPTAVGNAGKEFTIKVIANSTATVATTSSQNIDGATTKALGAQYSSITVRSDGTQWWIVAEYGPNLSLASMMTTPPAVGTFAMLGVLGAGLVVRRRKHRRQLPLIEG